MARSKAIKYLALGDSISIDRYTGVKGGGAVSQFAKLVDAQQVQDLTQDGFTTSLIYQSLLDIGIRPDIVTITGGGNDLLQRRSWNIDRYSICDPNLAEAFSNLRSIYACLKAMQCAVIVNTVYDPTDGNDTLAQQLGMSATFRQAYLQLNEFVREQANEHGFLLSDLQVLFAGHGMASSDTWITMEIEPNYAGSSAIADHSHRLLQPCR